MVNTNMSSPAQSTFFFSKKLDDFIVKASKEFSFNNSCEAQGTTYQFVTDDNWYYYKVVLESISSEEELLTIIEKNRLEAAKGYQQLCSTALKFALGSYKI